MNVIACLSQLIPPRRGPSCARKTLLTLAGVRKKTVALDRSLGKYEGEQ
jgi:hypothetical protein